MTGLLILVAVLTASPPDRTSVIPKVSPAEFRIWFDAARRGRLEIPDQTAQVARRHRFVFIGGLHIGVMPGYLAQNIKELRACGVPRGFIHVINPSSSHTISENAAEIRLKLNDLAALGPEKLVIIAHSRGACDALAFAIENPAFIADRVCALFLIQGPFGGSGVADYIAGDGPAIDREMPPVYRLAGRLVGRLAVSFMREPKHQAITSLGRKASHDYWERALEANPDAIPVVAPRIFYVTSQSRLSRHPLLQRVTAWYLGTYYGPNDGLVVLEDQAVSKLGTVLAVLDAGHTDLTHRFPSARPQPRLRRALIDAILMTVGGSHNHSAPTLDEELVRTSGHVRAPQR
jgi:pimeloyl-ACP methyl ester carboxylesterase